MQKVEKVLCTTPFPYCYGLPHLGNITTLLKSSIFSKLKSAYFKAGYTEEESLFCYSYHLTGLPLLNRIEKFKEAFKNLGPEEEKMEKLKALFKQECLQGLLPYIKKVNQVTSLKGWVHCINKYYTDLFFNLNIPSNLPNFHTTTEIDLRYSRFVNRIYEKLNANNLLYQGEKKILTCDTCKNVLGDHDRKTNEGIGINLLEVQFSYVLNFEQFNKQFQNKGDKNLNLKVLKDFNKSKKGPESLFIYTKEKLDQNLNLYQLRDELIISEDLFKLLLKQKKEEFIFYFNSKEYLFKLSELKKTSNQYVKKITEALNQVDNLNKQNTSATKDKTEQKELAKKGLFYSSSNLYFTLGDTICKCGGFGRIKPQKTWFVRFTDPKWSKKVLLKIDESENRKEIKQALKSHLKSLNDVSFLRKKGYGTRLDILKKTDYKEYIVDSLMDSQIHPYFYPFFLEKASLKGLNFSKKYRIDVHSTGKDLLPTHLLFFCYLSTFLLPNQKLPVFEASRFIVLKNFEKMSKTLKNHIFWDELAKKQVSPFDLKVYLSVATDSPSKATVFELEGLKRIAKTSKNHKDQLINLIELIDKEIPVSIYYTLQEKLLKIALNLNVTLKEDSLTLNLESGPNSYKIEEGPSNKDLQDQKYKEAGRPCTNRLKKMQIVTDKSQFKNKHTCEGFDWTKALKEPKFALRRVYNLIYNQIRNLLKKLRPIKLSGAKTESPLGEVGRSNEINVKKLKTLLKELVYSFE